MRGEMTRRIRLSPFPDYLERATLEYHASVQSYASTVSGIPVQSLVSYDPGQPSIPALSTLSLVLP